jgi:Tol biopolymer transport system component
MAGASRLAGLLAFFAVPACAGRSHHERTVYVEAGAPSEDGGAPAVGIGGRGGGGAGGRAAAGGRALGGAGGSSRAGAGGAMAGRAGMGGAPPCDLEQGDLELVTVTARCSAADGDAEFPRLTPDGRYVTFNSDAGDLVPNDRNGVSDAFLFDRETKTIELVSKAYGADGPSSGYGFTPVPSNDARYVLFTGMSYDLTATAPPEGLRPYLRDRKAGTTEWLSGEYACAYTLDLSGDGRFAVVEGFTNCQGALNADDYQSVVEYDLEAGTQRERGETGVGDNYAPAISRDGRFVLWATRPPMTRGQESSELLLYDRQTDSTETLPLKAFNFESTDISDDGAFVAFSSNGQVYRYERASDSLVLLSSDEAGNPGDDASFQVSMSSDGERLAFQSSATNLVPDDTNQVADIFVYDSRAKRVVRVSVANDGEEADDDSNYPRISAAGAHVTFVSKARNLSKFAPQGNFQVYVRSLGATPP